MRHSILSVALAVVTGACVPKSRAGATTATVGGAVLAVLGTAMLVDLKSPGDDTDGNGVDDFPENEIACALGGCAVAALLIASGLALGIGGIAAFNQLDDGGDEPAAAEVPVARAAAPSAAPLPTLDPRIVAPLPELPADAETIRLAQQARSAARDGHCEAASLVVERIGRHDPAYARALASGPALARCASRAR